MARFATFVVASLQSQRLGLQRVLLDDGSPAFVLTELTGFVKAGDRVVVNTTAVDLGLGTGGAHIVHWNLERERWEGTGLGHVMKLRYTSLQHDTGAAEEHLGADETTDLGGVPVVVCGLHSQLAAVAITVRHLRPGWRIALVMTDGAALPLALSDLVHALQEAGALNATITAGQAFGGNLEAVNVPSALALAAGPLRADVVVVAPGPGVVGTGTTLGFSSLEVASALDAAAWLGGVPIACIRYSGTDERPRHRGVSHHTLTALQAAGRPGIVVAVPRNGARSAVSAALEDAGLTGRHEVAAVDVPDVAGLLAVAGVTVTTMGRSPADDPDAFCVAAAAGVVASQVERRRGTVQG